MSQNWISTSAVALGTVALGILLYWVSQNAFLQRRRMELDSRARSMEYELQELKLRRDYSRASETSESSVIAELIRRQTEAIERLGHLEININNGDRGVGSFAGNPTPDDLGAENFAREIAHSLNTPLSQIQASALTLADSSDENARRISARIVSSVEAGKAYVAAMRQVAHATSTWEVKSLKASVSAAVTEFIEREDKQVNFTCDLPDTINGYSNSYLFAILLPLLENAAEAVPESQRMAVEARSDTSIHRITVENGRMEGDSDCEDFFVRGFTTKAGHEGLGLSFVERLVNGLSGSSISCEDANGVVRFTLTLPRSNP